MSTLGPCIVNEQDLSKLKDVLCAPKSSYTSQDESFCTTETSKWSKENKDNFCTAYKDWYGDYGVDILSKKIRDIIDTSPQCKYLPDKEGLINYIISYTDSNTSLPLSVSLSSQIACYSSDTPSIGLDNIIDQAANYLTEACGLTITGNKDVKAIVEHRMGIAGDELKKIKDCCEGKSLDQQKKPPISTTQPKRSWPWRFLAWLGGGVAFLTGLIAVAYRYLKVARAAEKLSQEGRERAEALLDEVKGWKGTIRKGRQLIWPEIPYVPIKKPAPSVVITQITRDMENVKGYEKDGDLQMAVGKFKELSEGAKLHVAWLAVKNFRELERTKPNEARRRRKGNEPPESGLPQKHLINYLTAPSFLGTSQETLEAAASDWLNERRKELAAKIKPEIGNIVSQFAYEADTLGNDTLDNKIKHESKSITLEEGRDYFARLAADEWNNLDLGQKTAFVSNADVVGVIRETKHPSYISGVPRSFRRKFMRDVNEDNIRHAVLYTRIVQSKPELLASLPFRDIQRIVLRLDVAMRGMSELPETVRSTIGNGDPPPRIIRLIRSSLQIGSAERPSPPKVEVAYDPSTSSQRSHKGYNVNALEAYLISKNGSLAYHPDILAKRVTALIDDVTITLGPQCIKAFESYDAQKDIPKVGGMPQSLIEFYLSLNPLDVGTSPRGAEIKGVPPPSPAKESPIPIDPELEAYLKKLAPDTRAKVLKELSGISKGGETYTMATLAKLEAFKGQEGKGSPDKDKDKDKERGLKDLLSGKTKK